MAHQSMKNFYRLHFVMVQIHKYSLAEIENMIVFERDLYAELLIQYLEEQAEYQRNQSRGA
jgi:hypothetical protein